MRTLIKKEEVTCKVCGSIGERLTFSDKTSQVNHPSVYNEKIGQYSTPVCKEESQIQSNY